jgi:hypothetical protein
MSCHDELKRLRNTVASQQSDLSSLQAMMAVQEKKMDGMQAEIAQRHQEILLMSERIAELQHSRHRRWDGVLLINAAIAFLPVALASSAWVRTFLEAFATFSGHYITVLGNLFSTGLTSYTDATIKVAGPRWGAVLVTITYIFVLLLLSMLVANALEEILKLIGMFRGIHPEIVVDLIRERRLRIQRVFSTWKAKRARSSLFRMVSRTVPWLGINELVEITDGRLMCHFRERPKGGMLIAIRA